MCSVLIVLTQLTRLRTRLGSVLSVEVTQTCDEDADVRLDDRLIEAVADVVKENDVKTSQIEVRTPRAPFSLTNRTHTSAIAYKRWIKHTQ